VNEMDTTCRCDAAEMPFGSARDTEPNG